MAKLKGADAHCGVLTIRVTSDWIALLDKWREAQPDRPNRVAAIRRLVVAAIDAATPRI